MSNAIWRPFPLFGCFEEELNALVQIFEGKKKMNLKIYLTVLLANCKIINKGDLAV